MSERSTGAGRAVLAPEAVPAPAVGTAPAGASDGPARASQPAPLAPGARFFPALAAVYRAQLSRARVARIPLLFVATFQSVGIMILMRGVVDGARRPAPSSPAPRCSSSPSSP